MGKTFESVEELIVRKQFIYQLVSEGRVDIPEGAETEKFGRIGSDGGAVL